MRICSLLAVAWLVPLPASACEAAGLEALVGALDRAEEALSVLDIAAFKAATVEGQDLLPCLDEPVPRHVAARIHRLVGLRAFGERDPLAPLAFAAARTIEPAYTFPRSLVPRGSPVLDTWAEVPITALETVELPAPASGWIEVDGRSTTTRASALPAVFQRFDATGAVAATDYLLPGEEPAPYEVASGRTAGPQGPPPPADPRWERARVPLGATAGASALVGGALWGLSVHGRSRYLDVTRNPVADDELDALRARTNALAVGSYVGAGVAVVTGALFVTTW